MLFGTSGIRGPSETLFTKQFCFDIGRAFSLFLKNHNQDKAVAIGMDPRGSSPRIKKDVISGLLFENRDVFDQGASPIPAMNYVLKAGSYYSGSIMVSGSHIKAELNGVKFFAFCEEILKKHEVEIEKIYESIKGKQKYKNLSKNIEYENEANEEYQEYISSFAFKNIPDLKAVVDCGDGAQSDTMPQVLKRIGIRVVELNCTIQGKFFARDTEIEDNFYDLKKKVLSENADFGVGYDADGDRVVFVDEKGKYITGDYSGTLIALNFKGDSVVTPINSSQVIDKIGKTIYRTKVGSPYVVEKMKEVGAYFGFEANGGGIFKDMMSRDGGRSTIEVINIMAKSDKRLSEIIAELPKYYIYRDKVEYNWELKDKIINSAKKSFNGIKQDETDGLKIWVDDNTWILFRSSMNAPEFRVFVESKDDEKAKKLIKEGLAFVKKHI